MKFLSLSFIIFFSLWIVLSGYFDLLFLICGLCSSILTLLIFKRLIAAEHSLANILNNTSRFSFRGLVRYIPWLVYQIILSSIYVTKKILQRNLKLTPVIISKISPGHNAASIVLFTNSITITPGTFTINVEHRQEIYLSIICLIDKDLENGVYEIENQVLSNCLQ